MADAEHNEFIPVRVSSTSKALHHLFVKKHEPSETDIDKLTERTLFVTNVPPFLDQGPLSLYFGECGEIDDVFIHHKPTSKVIPDQKNDLFAVKDPPGGYKVAYIVYKETSSLKRALDPDFNFKCDLFSGKRKPFTGIRKWCHNYGKHYIHEDKLQKSINEYLENYDRSQQEEQDRSRTQDGVPDDDGWITVTRHSKNKGLSRTEVSEKKVTTREKEKRKEKELLNFYTFQQRETQKDHIAKLRQKFEEDKTKVQQMKAARKFKPY